VCSYEIPVRLKKETLREEIKDLKAQLQQSEATIQKLSTLQSSGYISHQGTMVPLGSVSNQFDMSFSTSDFMGVPNISQSLGHGSPMGNNDAQSQRGIVDRWTDVTSNQEFIEHLSILYFRWEYPLFASVSKDQFLADFRTGRQNYCSPLLVNAILAVGCRFSGRPESRAAPGDADPGNHFFAEAQRLLPQQREDSLTKVQALGLMSIREAACGRDSESWFYSGQAIRIAVEMGLHKPSFGVSLEEQRVRTATFWGAFTLDQ
jgi:Fungal specific transcription factor domain